MVATAVSLATAVCDQVVTVQHVDDIDEVHQLDPVHQVDHKDEHRKDHMGESGNSRSVILMLAPPFGLSMLQSTEERYQPPLKRYLKKWFRF